MANIRKLIFSTSLLSAAQLSRVIFGVLILKFASVYLSTDAVGTYGLIQNYTTILITIFSVGLPLSGVQILTRHGLYRLKQLLPVYNVLAGLAGIISFTLLSIFGKHVLIEMDWKMVLLLSFGIYFGVRANIYLASFQFQSKIKEIFMANLVASTMAFLVSVLTFYIQKGSIFYVQVFVYFIILFFYYNRINKIKKEHLVFQTVKDIFDVGFLLSMVGFIPILTMFLFRLYLTSHGGLNVLGLVVAAFTVINGYANMIFTSIAGDFFPRYSRATSKEERRDIERGQTQLLLIILLPIVVALYLYAPLLVQLLYSKEYGEIISIIRVGSIALFFRGVSTVRAYIFLSYQRNTLYFIIEIIVNILLLVMLILGYEYKGLVGIGLALTIHAFIYFIMVEILLGHVGHHLNFRNQIIFSVMVVFLWLFLDFTLALPQIFIAMVVLLTVLLSLFVFRARWIEG